MISDADLLSHIDFLVARAENSGDDITGQAAVLIDHALALDAHAVALLATLTTTPTKTIITRPYDTDFVVSATRPALVRYISNQTASPPLLNSASSLIELLVNGVTEDRAKVEIDLLGALTLIAADDDRSVWSILVAGDVVRLRKTLTGTATATFLTGIEVVF